RLRVGHPAAFAVADRHFQNGAVKPFRERRAVAFHADAHPVGPVREVGVANECAWEEAGLAEDLKAVAASEDRAALGREAAKLLRTGRELRDRAGAQVVAVAEASGDDRRVEAPQIYVLVPLNLRLDAVDERERVGEVALAPGPGIPKDRYPRHHHQFDACARGDGQ